MRKGTNRSCIAYGLICQSVEATSSTQITWPRPMGDFTREHRGTSQPMTKAAGLTNSYQEYRAYLQTPTLPSPAIEEWVRWLISRYSTVAFHQTDPAEFRLGDHVDFITCFEHAIGRLQKRCFLRGMTGAFDCRVEAAGPPGGIGRRYRSRTSRVAASSLKLARSAR